MKAFWDAFALKIVWDSLFMNDAHFIVSRRGLEVLYKMRQKEALIDLMDICKDFDNEQTSITYGKEKNDAR